MSLHIIVDGYNLIRQSKTFRHLDRQHLQSGRDALVDVLAVYKKHKAHRITVVFDGTRAPYLAPSRDRVKGIAVQFSRDGESADTVIKRLARQEREKAVVVSSDREVVAAAQSSGAAVLSTAEFENRLSMAQHLLEVPAEAAEDAARTPPTTKKKGPRRRLSKRRRRNRMRISKL